MKLPHHGHKDSITPKLLDMLAPQHAVISISNTRTDDCPSSIAIEAIRTRNCALYMTDAVRKNGISIPNHSSVHFVLTDWNGIHGKHILLWYSGSLYSYRRLRQLAFKKWCKNIPESIAPQWIPGLLLSDSPWDAKNAKNLHILDVLFGCCFPAAAAIYKAHTGQW